MVDGATEVSESALADATARIIAFYLPQYHPIPENDVWWGKDFTDWTNVRRARPLFEGHDQPRVPSRLGYYDLRDVNVHHAQAALAKAHGVGAFCYYAYWFGGRRLLEAPLDLVAANPDLAMPYAICWANEPWSRRWDGSENEILVEQRHSPGRDAAFIDEMAGHLSDPRYVRVNGKPLLLIYRAGLLADPLKTTDALRDRAVQLGVGEICLAMVQSFGHWDPIGYGFDAAVEFPPQSPNLDSRTDALRPLRHQDPAQFEFMDAIRLSLTRPDPVFPWFRAVMPGWDNTPRRGTRGTAFVGVTPMAFRQWLEEILRWTYLFRLGGERLVFVNAWNEWAEGAYLEPDQTHGTAFLEAVRTALDGTAAFATESAGLMANGPADSGMIAEARRAWGLRNAVHQGGWLLR